MDAHRSFYLHYDHDDHAELTTAGWGFTLRRRRRAPFFMSSF